MTNEQELIQQLSLLQYLRNFYSTDFFGKQINLDNLSKDQRKEILRDIIKYQGLSGRSNEAVNLLNWIINGVIDVNIYPYHYNDNMEVWAWSPRGPVVRVGQGSGQLVKIDDRQKIIDHFHRYQEVRFFFQELGKESSY